MSWEDIWQTNKLEKKTSFGIDTGTIQKRKAQNSFGADSTVVRPAGSTAPVVVQHGGGLANGILLILGGFAVGTLWGKQIIDKVI